MWGKVKNIYFDMQKLGKKYNLFAPNQRFMDKLGRGGGNREQTILISHNYEHDSLLIINR
jgi:hypothetical protein